MKIMGNYGAGHLVLVMVLSIGLGFGTHASARERAYLIDLNSKTAMSLGTLLPSAINDAGQVVGGFYTASGQYHAFMTGPNGVGVTDLGTLSGDDYSFADSINATGQVVGGSAAAVDVFDQEAFMTGPNGVGMASLGLPGRSQVVDINDTGQAIGRFYTATGQYHAFITGPNGIGMTELGTLGGSTYARGINAAGQVVRTSSTIAIEDRFHAFMTGANGIGMTDLGTLGGYSSAASDINATGQVVGRSDAAHGLAHAFITGPNGVGITDLGTLGGSSYANGINDAGQVVGLFDTSDRQSHAFITGPNGVGMTDLNSLVDLPGSFFLKNAIAINNMGQVIAISNISLVPELESYALMLAGLAFMGFMVRRKQKG